VPKPCSIAAPLKISALIPEYWRWGAAFLGLVSEALRGACAALRQGSSPEWAEMRANVLSAVRS
jgi:hypothetical protein